MPGRDDWGSKSCPNCEILERAWASLLDCGNEFTPFHDVHEQPHVLWNDVHPRRCLTVPEPVVQVNVVECGNSDAFCFHDSTEHVARQVYVAGVLRLDLALRPIDSVSLADYPRKIYRRASFVSQMWSTLRINVLFGAGDREHLIVDPKTNTTELLVKMASLLSHGGRKTKVTFNNKHSENIKNGEALIKEAFISAESLHSSDLEV